MPKTRMCDLPPELVGEEILTRVPITSLRAVRSTCTTWDAFTKNWILGKEAKAKQQFLGFMTMNSKVCSLSFHLKQKGDKKDMVDLSINQVYLLNQVEISEVFHCNGLLLCVAKDSSKLVLWNPYLRQTRCIGPRTNFHQVDRYALGHDMNRNQKILRFVDHYFPVEKESVFEIYELSSNSWRVLNVTPSWEIDARQRGVSVMGNTYFFAQEKLCDIETDEYGYITEIEDFLLCFDFTRERFGPRLPLPFHSYPGDSVTLSCVRDEQLAVLYFQEEANNDTSDKLEIWVTTRIEPNNVSWRKFLNVEMRSFAPTGCGFKFYSYECGSFFVDEEEKVAVVFDLDGYLPTKTTRYHTAFIIGEDGYFKRVSLGEAPIVGIRCPRTGDTAEIYCPALVCSSSYRPSLVQVNQQPRKRKER